MCIYICTTRVYSIHECIYLNMSVSALLCWYMNNQGGGGRGGSGPFGTLEDEKGKYIILTPRLEILKSEFSEDRYIPFP